MVRRTIFDDHSCRDLLDVDCWLLVKSLLELINFRKVFGEWKHQLHQLLEIHQDTAILFKLLCELQL